MNTNINYVTWYSAYNNVRNIEENERVQVNMIWGCLWDESLQWLVDSGSKSYYEVGVNSSSWGNYRNVSFNYTTVSGTTATKSGMYQIPSGSAEHNNSNSIYDLAANVHIWTLNSNSNFGRQFRSNDYDNYGYEFSASYCLWYTAPSWNAYNVRCARLLLL